MKYFFAGAGLLVIFSGLAGCKNRSTEPAGQNEPASPAPAANVSETGTAVRMARADEVGKEAVCPVMGVKFKVTPVTQAADYKGKTYYFCCNTCPPEFQKNPDKYAK